MKLSDFFHAFRNERVSIFAAVEDLVRFEDENRDQNRACYRYKNRQNADYFGRALFRIFQSQIFFKQRSLTLF